MDFIETKRRIEKNGIPYASEQSRLNVESRRGKYHQYLRSLAPVEFLRYRDKQRCGLEEKNGPASKPTHVLCLHYQAGEFGLT